MNRLLRSILALCFLLFSLSSCFNEKESLIVQNLSPKKQKQKIAFLQKKLKIAEKEQQKIVSEVERISQEIDEAQIALIHKQLDEYKRREGQDMTLFMEEREALYKMIQSGPSPSAFDAQVELDRILRIITELSDGERSFF